MDDLKGKAAVITGAGSGIGLALAKQCLEQGMDVLLADIDGAALEASLSALPQDAGKFATFTIDVTAEDQVRELYQVAVKFFDRVHVLFNNAGVAIPGRAWENSARDWEWVFAVNVMGAAHTLRYFVPHMLAHGEPAYIVNTASLSGLTTGFGQALYQASKHALVSLSESLYCDLRMAGSAIGVSVLCPAFVRTNILESERHRPQAYMNTLPRRDAPRNGFRQAMHAALRAAPAPESVAAQVFQAMREHRFYVIPDQGADDMIEDRIMTLMQRHNPLLPLLP
jgi:NAD(P)-dependent dehydrogenase (short-subunit alcohol dehydrogenase family)